MFYLFFTIYFLLIILVLSSVVCVSKSFTYDENSYLEHFLYNVEENKREDDLPPYTPPSPRTKAAMADLPPSYEITRYINMLTFKGNNVSSIDNNSATAFVNPYLYTMPEIVVITQNSAIQDTTKVQDITKEHDTTKKQDTTIQEIVIIPLNTEETTIQVYDASKVQYTTKEQGTSKEQDKEQDTNQE